MKTEVLLNSSWLSLFGVGCSGGIFTDHTGRVGPVVSDKYGNSSVCIISNRGVPGSEQVCL